ncbi:MAG: porin family protein [Bacteroidaceae bacterium]|nr:porin family protein [Bacteroidaceae bacterium]
MKKIFTLAFALCLLVSIPANAQFDFGIKAGTNLTGSPKDIDKDFNSDGCTGFFVGPTAKFTLPIVGLGVQADILYSHSAVEIEGEKIKRNSIEVPIYLRYDLALPVVSKVIVPFLAVGPQFGYTIGDGKETFENVAEFEYKKSQFSLNFGGGAKILSHVLLHVNYNVGLGNTSELKIKNTPDIYKSRTNTWQVSVGYIF